MQATWEIALLGRARLRGGGAEVKRLERKAAALLAYVALEGPTARSRLAGLLWPAAGERQARASLRQLLFKMKQHRGLIVPDELVELCPGVAVDAVGLRTWHARGDHRKVADVIVEGSCELLSGLDYDDCSDLNEWVLVERERMLSMLCDALGAVATQLEKDASYREALPYARRLLDLDPISEVGYRRLMRLHSLAGDRAAALEVYRRCRTVLARTMDIEPLPETTELARAIEDGDGPERGPVLPVPATPLVGRGEELVALERHLAAADRRLVTINGPGGVGKTRLAIEAAASLGASFADGVHFVSAATIDTEQQLVSAVASAIGFEFYSPEDPLDQLLRHLAERELLLVLDDFEHLSDGRGLVSEVQRMAAKVTQLVTSRERLQISGESVLQLDGLGIPASDSLADVLAADAGRLFVQSAQRAASGFVPTHEQAPAVARICRAVQGLPLGIELAAAWIWALSAEEIAQGIEANLDLLATTRRDVPERHRSLHAACAHSWELLTDQERGVFSKLSVFRGGFTKDAAAHVAGATLATLLALMSRSLLARSPAGRFEMHELLRHFAQEKLCEDPSRRAALERAHGTYYLRLLQQPAEQAASGRADPFHEVDREIANVQAAWRWATTGAETDTILKSDAALQVYFELRGRCLEGVEAFDRAIAALDPNVPTQREALGYAFVDRGWLSYLLGRHEEARRSAEQGVALLRPLRSPRGMQVALTTLGNLALDAGAYAEARPPFLEALALAREEAHPARTARFLGNLALVEHELGNYAEAERYYIEVLQRSRQAADHYAVVITLLNLGTLRLATDHLQEAERLFQEGLDLATSMQYGAIRPNFLNNLAAVALEAGDFVAARASNEEALALAREHDDAGLIASCLIGSGRASLRLADLDRAEADFAQAVEAAREVGRRPKVLSAVIGFAELRAEQGHPVQAAALLTCVLDDTAVSPEDRAVASLLLSRLHAGLSPEARAQATATGRATRWEEAADLVSKGAAHPRLRSG